MAALDRSDGSGVGIWVEARLSGRCYGVVVRNESGSKNCSKYVCMRTVIQHRLTIIYCLLLSASSHLAGFRTTVMGDQSANKGGQAMFVDAWSNLIAEHARSETPRCEVELKAVAVQSLRSGLRPRTFDRV